MNLIRVSKDVLVNPDRIDAVEVKSIGGKVKSLTVVVGGKSYISEVEPDKLFRDFIGAGVNLHEQFFAG